MIKSDYIVCDCETGGLSSDKNPITQYAAVILDGCTLKEKDRYETFVKPYNDLKIEKQALEHTMVTMSDINGGIKLDVFCKTITEWWESHRANCKFRDIGRLIIVGHNITFDIDFINYALHLSNMGDIYDYIMPNFIDTYAIGKMMWGVNNIEKLTLSSCCDKANIKLTDAHGAMNDVEATADLFRFFVKKLRMCKNSTSSSINNIKKGQDFFEFKCAVK